jgi:hypothetical protein
MGDTLGLFETFLYYDRFSEAGEGTLPPKNVERGIYSHNPT